jgi:hypothetical protein
MFSRKTVSPDFGTFRFRSPSPCAPADVSGGKIAAPAATQDFIPAGGLPPPLAGYTSSLWWR